MNKFEAVVLFSPDLIASNLSKHDVFFKEQISKINGSVINQEDWGLRELSYSIKNNKKAFYKFYQLEVEGSKIQDVKKSLTQNEQIIRHLFIKVNNHEDLPTILSLKQN